MNPTCRDIEGLLSAYLDRELDPLVARRVEEHLVSCVACSDALAAMREAGRVLAAAVPLRSEAEWEALALRVEMAIDREEARVFQEAASQEVVAATVPDFEMASPRAAAIKRERVGRRTRGFGWWAYGSGAVAAAMLVLLLWPWFKEHVEEGPPAPRASAPQLGVPREEPAPSPSSEQETLSLREPTAAQEPASPPTTTPGSSPAKPLPTEKRDAASSAERKLTSVGGVQSTIQTERDAQQNAAGALRSEEASRMKVETKEVPVDQASRPYIEGIDAPPLVKRNLESTKDSDGQAQLQKSTDGGSAPNAPETAAEAAPAPSEQPSEYAVKKARASEPQPIPKNEAAESWSTDQPSKGFRAQTKSMSRLPASDTPPPPTVKHFSETEWAEMSELQTQEALKAGTEKSLAEATHVLESFLKEYPRSVFRPEVSANLLRTTSTLVQLNPNLWCERATAALEGWRLEKPPPAINVDAEIATIEGRCLK